MTSACVSTIVVRGFHALPYAITPPTRATFDRDTMGPLYFAEMREHILRVDCLNHPHFFVEVDLDTTELVQDLRQQIAALEERVAKVTPNPVTLKPATLNPLKPRKQPKPLKPPKLVKSVMKLPPKPPKLKK